MLLAKAGNSRGLVVADGPAVSRSKQRLIVFGDFLVAWWAFKMDKGLRGDDGG